MNRKLAKVLGLERYDYEVWRDGQVLATGESKSQRRAFEELAFVCNESRPHDTLTMIVTLR